MASSRSAAGLQRCSMPWRACSLTHWPRLYEEHRKQGEQRSRQTSFARASQGFARPRSSRLCRLPSAAIDFCSLREISEAFYLQTASQSYHHRVFTLRSAVECACVLCHDVAVYVSACPCVCVSARPLSRLAPASRSAVMFTCIVLINGDGAARVTPFLLLYCDNVNDSIAEDGVL